MLCAYIGVEGYVLKRMYIIKELTVLYENGNSDHYRFEPPTDLMLTPDEAKTVRFASKHLNGLSYHDGSVSYTELKEIMDKLSGLFKCYIAIFKKQKKKTSFLTAMISDLTK